MGRAARPVARAIQDPRFQLRGEYRGNLAYVAAVEPAGDAVDRSPLPDRGGVHTSVGGQPLRPGVQVVADYDEPVFYSDNFYWRYDSGNWYRSPYYNRAWVSVSAPPVAVRQIQRPRVQERLF